jgi:hypothetical protein
MKKPGAPTPGFDCELPAIAGKPTQTIFFLHHLPSVCKTGGCLELHSWRILNMILLSWFYLYYHRPNFEIIKNDPGINPVLNTMKI